MNLIWQKKEMSRQFTHYYIIYIYYIYTYILYNIYINHRNMKSESPCQGTQDFPNIDIAPYWPYNPHNVVPIHVWYISSQFDIENIPTGHPQKSKNYNKPCHTTQEDEWAATWAWCQDCRGAILLIAIMEVAYCYLFSKVRFENWC